MALRSDEARRRSERAYRRRWYLSVRPNQHHVSPGRRADSSLEESERAAVLAYAVALEQRCHSIVAVPWVAPSDLVMPYVFAMSFSSGPFWSEVREMLRPRRGRRCCDLMPHPHKARRR